MTYVISDIHGNMARFEAMLEKIHFSDSDTLYVLGDVIDRGPDGIAILQKVMATPNMVMLLGNHEHMMIDYLCHGAWEYGGKCWRNTNGGEATLLEYKKLSKEEKERIKGFLLNLEDHKEISINGQDFHLVHGYPADCTFDRVWGRVKLHSQNPIPGKIVIVGHTPVMNLCLKRWEDTLPMEIVELPGIFDIDCGCCYPGGRLGCLRLEDLAEFYVD